MQLVSEPEFTEETVTDLDIWTTTGMLPLTLHEGDTIEETDYGILVSFKREPVEVLKFYWAHIVYTASRQRIVRRPVIHPTVDILSSQID